MTKKCEEPGCTKQAGFGTEYGKPALRCGRHKLDGQVQVKNKRCEEPGCLKRPSFGTVYGKPLRCGRHKLDGQVDVISKQCDTGVHLENPPSARYTLSSGASIRVDGVGTVPKPELAGTRCCLECLKRMDPTNIAVKLHLRKEFIVISAIAEGLAARGKHQGIELAHILAKTATHDCALGPSRRRPDLHIPLANGLHLVFENDEDAHRDRTTSCENAKLAGTLMDLGLPGAQSEADGRVCAGGGRGGGAHCGAGGASCC